MKPSTCSRLTSFLLGLSLAAIFLAPLNVARAGDTAQNKPVVAPKPPVITSSANASGRVGQSFSHHVQSNSLATYSAKLLPAEYCINAVTGEISGVPMTEGVHIITVQAQNASGTHEATLRIVILPAKVK